MDLKCGLIAYFSVNPSQLPHAHLRKENNCLNCGATVNGRYCSGCGQENVTPKESAAHMVRHFFEDFTHFDGKFFKSIKYLFTKPGFLSREYMAGKRASYLNPVRLYLFTSALFFFILYTFFAKPGRTDPAGAYVRDTIQQNGHFRGMAWEYIDGLDEPVFVLGFDRIYNYNGVAVYDSIQRSLPESSIEKDKGIFRFVFRRLAATATIYHKDPNDFVEKMSERFLHSFSKIVIISLPLFAVFLWILYFRRRKEFYFVTHAIFSIHYYCVLFLLILLALLIGSHVQTDTTVERIFGGTVITIVLAFVYLYVAMLRFYRQKWLKTFIKAVLVMIPFILSLGVLTTFFLLNSMISLAK